jgi:hypothetical protein
MKSLWRHSFFSERATNMESKNGIMSLDYGSNPSIEREDSNKVRLVSRGARPEYKKQGDQLNAKMLKEDLRQGQPKKNEILKIEEEPLVPENSFEKFRRTHAEKIIKGVNTSIGFEIKPGDESKGNNY